MRPAALWLALVISCQSTIEEQAPQPSDLDRQCDPAAGCQGGLRCVRLRAVPVVTDGGLGEAQSHTCHPACASDSECPTDYLCYTTEVEPIEQVCVQAEVVRLLRGG